MEGDTANIQIALIEYVVALTMYTMTRRFNMSILMAVVTGTISALFANWELKIWLSILVPFVYAFAGGILAYIVPFIISKRIIHPSSTINGNGEETIIPGITTQDMGKTSKAIIIFVIIILIAAHIIDVPISDIDQPWYTAIIAVLAIIIYSGIVIYFRKNQLKRFVWGYVFGSHLTAILVVGVFKGALPDEPVWSYVALAIHFVFFALVSLMSVFCLPNVGKPAPIAVSTETHDEL